jgi:hypothetical protein
LFHRFKPLHVWWEMLQCPVRFVLSFQAFTRVVGTDLMCCSDRVPGKSTRFYFYPHALSIHTLLCLKSACFEMLMYGGALVLEVNWSCNVF